MAAIPYFGALTEIDVAARLRPKAGIERSPYRILGAHNPPLAAQALEPEPDVGQSLNCNVVVFEESERAVEAPVSVQKEDANA